MAGDFIDLRAWREAAALAATTCALARRMRGPGAGPLMLQTIRAALSVPANIAEGHGRGPGRDCVRFLRIARGSAAEVESHLRVAVLAGYLTESDASPVIRQARFVRFLTKRLSESIESRVA
jgi:four helix bundle protein